MQTYNITQLKADLTGIGHGTTLNKVINIDGLILRACRQVMSDIDLKETVVKHRFTLYKDIYDYVCPTDIKGNKIIDIYPVNLDYNVAVYGQKYNQSFNRNAAGGWINNDLNYDYDAYKRAIKINAKMLPQPIVIDKAVDSATYSGTVTNLITDPINYKINKQSVRFNVSTGQYVQKVFADPLDLSSHFNLSTLFFNVYLSGAVTSLEFRIGFDNSNYYSWTILTDSLNNSLTEGWHTIKMNWENVVVVGSPSALTINQIELHFNTPTPIIANINNFTSNLGKEYEMSYYSENLFRNNLTGIFESTPSSDSSFLNASNEGYNMIINQVAMYMVQQVQGESMSSDMNYFAGEYKRCLDKQKLEYKSQIQKPQEYYYKVWQGGDGNANYSNNYPIM
jgi:hypothetical protein